MTTRRATVATAFAALLVLLPFSSSAPGDQFSPTVDHPEALDGGLWKSSTDAQKVYYLMGYSDALWAASSSASKSIAGEFDLMKHLSPSSWSNLKLCDELDKFYAESDNFRIPISSAIELLAAQSSGATAEQIRKRLVDLRVRAVYRVERDKERHQ